MLWECVASRSVCASESQLEHATLEHGEKVERVKHFADSLLTFIGGVNAKMEEQETELKIRCPQSTVPHASRGQGKGFEPGQKGGKGPTACNGPKTPRLTPPAGKVATSPVPSRGPER